MQNNVQIMLKIMLEIMLNVMIKIMSKIMYIMMQNAPLTVFCFKMEMGGLFLRFAVFRRRSSRRSSRQRPRRGCR